ncbi:1,6-anhydro-N-acetylmuramyl-L-alanine amidase AmpD [Gilvimarinus sp. DA14]|uniref:1,6-anhydro-N-acetylmuramyl-L-alanine amidase AmpD n=1 Tax=Gilvimarinus sp. DA14 TaxID=2956798 RepID=UPI0020B665B3|nr:1,6-anhydro-N-acetylmuramyl-L-alanine amidase AmpD [Gilvimarinus sp. DA14]UTF59664.1 1,6-anhydro-N-acetylmuramyl-L-alanine amidase AmpD [Gilvimarinus sp. DA14]
MSFVIADGWFEGVKHCPSPNFGERPAGSDISLLVIHNISLPPGEYENGHVERFFTNCLDAEAHPYFAEIAQLQVSAHALISRSGELVQFVSLDDRAWHAGRSCFAGVEECNDYSIGIELEGTDTDPYTDAQYQTLTQAAQAIMRKYPGVTSNRIAGHSDIAPGRKTDPGDAFDWARFLQALKHDTP